MRHFLDSIDLTAKEWSKLLAETARLKKAEDIHARPAPLVGRVLGLVFEKPSLRTRVSFQAAIAGLGGSSVFMSGNEVGLGSREPSRFRPRDQPVWDASFCEALSPCR